MQMDPYITSSTETPLSLQTDSIRLAANLRKHRPAPFLLLSLLSLLAMSAFVSCAAIRPIPEHEHSLRVTATAYNSLPAQTQGNPEIGAWGDRMTPGLRAIAVSPDLLSRGLKRGTKVHIQGLPGQYVVLDKMPSRWKNRIDIYLGTDIKAARLWGKRKVMIYWSSSGSDDS